MQLGPADFELDMPRLKQQLSQTPGETLMLAGLRINLHRLHPQFQQLSEAELKEQIRDTDRHIASLEVRQQTAEQRHQAEAHKQRLEQEQQQLRQGAGRLRHLAASIGPE